jgi:UV DNA damage repair endonuclease
MDITIDVEAKAKELAVLRLMAEVAGRGSAARQTKDGAAGD